MRETGPRQRAVYRGIICLILRNRPIDFYENKIITTELLLDRKIDDHHIFPDAYLETQKVQKYQRDCIINRTLIDRKTNQRIGKRPPVEYLKDIEKRIGQDILNKIIRTHLIAVDAITFCGESFNDFLDNRLEMLRKNIQEVTGKEIAKADGLFEKK